MNADPRVMEHFPASLMRAQSDDLADRAREQIRRRGWGLWAVEVTEPMSDVPASADPGSALGADAGHFVGFVGLAVPGFDAPFMPAVEVGWRLESSMWGRGYAPEAARAAAAFARDELRLAELVSFTTVGNVNSRRVMEKLGMAHDPADDFDHPALAGHPLRRHVLYRLELDVHASFGGDRR